MKKILKNLFSSKKFNVSPSKSKWTVNLHSLMCLQQQPAGLGHDTKLFRFEIISLTLKHVFYRSELRNIISGNKNLPIKNSF